MMRERETVYLGVDDFSFRCGYQFGTILVDLESHGPIDLLPNRQAETAATWMADNPEIHVVSRDRGTAYASAATQGAPQAIQVADRFHICKNLTEATQLLLARCQPEIAAGSRHRKASTQRERQTHHLHRRMASKRTCPGKEKTLNSAGRTPGLL